MAGGMWEIAVVHMNAHPWAIDWTDGSPRVVWARHGGLAYGIRRRDYRAPGGRVQLALRF